MLNTTDQGIWLKDLFTISNGISLCRVAISVVFASIMALGTSYGWSTITLGWSLLATLIVMEISDWLDGFLARRLDQVSAIGKILDPMADATSRSIVLLAFTLPPVSMSPLWLIPFMVRDFITALLRTFWAGQGVAHGARYLGKLKAWVQGMTAIMTTVGIIQLGLQNISAEQLHHWQSLATAVAACFSIAAAIDHLVVTAHRLQLKSLR